MISLEKISSKINAISTPITKAKSKLLNRQGIPVDLNGIPHYKITAPISIARKYLSEFISQYGRPKSSTYNSVEIQKAKLDKCSNDILEGLYEKGRTFKNEVKRMRKNMWSQKFASYEDYLQALSIYVKKNGTYINCQETADLVQHLLAKDGIKSQMIFMYTVDKNGQRINKAEHVFCVTGLDKNANIQDVSTWGASCAICDPWANIAMSVHDGIKYYEKLFNLNKDKQTFNFELIGNSFPGEKHG